MATSILDIPDTPNEMAAWLDLQLVGQDLAGLVAELAAVHRLSGPERSQTEAEAGRAWLGDACEAVLRNGLTAAPPDQVGQLLRHPGVLLGLQELILIEGGPYWEALIKRAQPSEAELPAGVRNALTVAEATLPLRSAVDQTEGAPPATRARSTLPLDAGQSGHEQTRTRRLLSIAVSLAAALLIAVAAWTLGPPADPAWGWNKPEALAAADPPAYFEQLARYADEWSLEKAESETQLQLRLEQLIAGCDRLIGASHASLEETDRTWLVEKCRAWREKLVEQQDALLATHDIAAVGAATDAIVAKLIVALNTHADELRRAVS